jgi:hypothetical protein
MAVGDSGFAGSSVTPPSVSPEIVPESLCQSDPATVGIIGSSGPESVDVAKVLKELQAYQKSSQDEIKKLQDDTSMLSLLLDMASLPPSLPGFPPATRNFSKSSEATI